MDRRRRRGFDPDALAREEAARILGFDPSSESGTRRTRARRGERRRDPYADATYREALAADQALGTLAASLAFATPTAENAARLRRLHRAARDRVQELLLLFQNEPRLFEPVAFAEEVRDFLLEHGVARDQLEEDSYSEDETKDSDVESKVESDRDYAPPASGSSPEDDDTEGDDDDTEGDDDTDDGDDDDEDVGSLEDVESD